MPGNVDVDKQVTLIGDGADVVTVRAGKIGRGSERSIRGWIGIERLHINCCIPSSSRQK